MRASSVQWVIDAADFQRAVGPWAIGFDLLRVPGELDLVGFHSWLCFGDLFCLFGCGQKRECN